MSSKYRRSLTPERSRRRESNTYKEPDRDRDIDARSREAAQYNRDRNRERGREGERRPSVDYRERRKGIIPSLDAYSLANGSFSE